jgi:hypothetical protein
MESPNIQSSRRSDAALKLNRALENRVARWKAVRLTAAIGLAVIGMLAALFEGFAIYSIPCLIGAFIAALLYLDARDQLREVRSRTWDSATPRIGNHTAGERTTNTADVKGTSGT